VEVELLCLSVIHASQVATARRLATSLAGDLGCNEIDTGTVALLATEVATNLVKHATDGQLLMQPVLEVVV
jgi:anti-sigma regulatory factor (Ser/Thr protein kinase)